MEIAIFNLVHELIPRTEVWVFIFKRISFFGTGFAIYLVITIAVTYLLLRLQFHKAHILVLGGVVSLIASSVIKKMVARPRPDLLPHLERVSSMSFPSGHAMVSLVVYGILAVFIAEAYPKWRRLIYSIAAIFIFMIGLSRIYLSVHWPTDVIGGWVIGSTILALSLAWYKKGDVLRVVRIGIGVFLMVIGVVGLILPLIPGIPLLIGGFILAFSNRPLSEMFKKKQKLDPKRDIIIEPSNGNSE